MTRSSAACKRSFRDEPILGATLNIGSPIPKLPYLYTESLEAGCRRISQAGFSSIDLLLTDTLELSCEMLQSAVSGHGLRISAIASGGAWLQGKLHLCSANPEIRRLAEKFVSDLLVLAGPGQAVILGLLAGILEDSVTRAQALGWLLPALDRLAETAGERGATLLIEPLNPAETNFLTCLDDGIDLLRNLRNSNIRLLADIYHLSRTETSIPQAIRRASGLIGHVHVADSNRRAPGFGNLDFPPVWRALDDIGYTGCLSVEAFPWPDSNAAAAQSITALRSWFSDPKSPIGEHS